VAECMVACGSLAYRSPRRKSESRAPVVSRDNAPVQHSSLRAGL
jgi:hypothetical protein